MKAIIIEDEEPAAQALELLVSKLYPEIAVSGIIQSVDESVEWLSLNAMPDLIFMDIHLSDDLSFSIFDHIKITCPVIFITAYNQYALKAFEANGIDYLLKPVDEKELIRAVEKYKSFSVQRSDNSEVIKNLIDNLRSEKRKYKSYFLLPQKDQLIPLAVKEIAYAYINTKTVYIVTGNEQKKHVELTLDELMEQLDPTEFYRANRQYIISRAAIKNITIWFGNKLYVNLTIPTPERIFVSKSRAKDFKNWITG